MKNYRHLAAKSAKSLLAASLFSGIGQSDHGNKWDFEYFDKKFQFISSTFEMVQSEIQMFFLLLSGLPLGVDVSG